MLHRHVGVGHKDIECYEHARHQHIGRQVNQETQERSQHQIVGERICHRCHEDGNTRGHHDDDGEAEEHGQIVSEGAKQTSGLRHLPYFIESILHIAHQHQHRVEHKQQTDAQEHPTLRMHQITVHETDNDFSCLRLRRQRLTKPHLDILAETEASCNSEHHSQYGHDSQQRTVRQSRRLLHHTLR